MLGFWGVMNTKQRESIKMLEKRGFNYVNEHGEAVYLNRRDRGGITKVAVVEHDGSINGQRSIDYINAISR